MKPNVEKVETEEVMGLKRARWVTKEELSKIEEVISRSGGRAVTRAPIEDEPYGPTVYELEEEPLMVFNKVSTRDPKYVGWVFPSEKHAKMIHEAGILTYPELEVKTDAQNR